MQSHSNAKQQQQPLSEMIQFTTMKQSITHDIPRDYHSLCEHYLPRPIRSQARYQSTLAVIANIKNTLRKLTKDQQDYLDLLNLLIQRYEGLAIASSTPPALALLKQLIEKHRLNKSDLSRILGRSLALVSMILSGQRKITQEHANRLGKYFSMSPEPFLT